MEKRVTRKLHWHIMSRFVMLTVLNHMDRANLVCCNLCRALPLQPVARILIILS